GLTSGQLRSLFREQVGAAPATVLDTRRLHFAKRLLDETALEMEEVALAAGFGSLRRFEAAIRNTYKRTPAHIRSLVRQNRPQPPDQYLFRLEYRAPLAWDRMLQFLALRAIPGVESVVENRYTRTIAVQGQPGWLEAWHE